MIKRILPPLIFILVVLVAWELAVRLLALPEFLLPSPNRIAGRLSENMPALLPHVLVTGTEAVLGFFLGMALGVSLAVIFVYSRTVEQGVYPYAIALKNIPVVALAPLLVVWFGNGIFPKVLVAAIICFFPVVVNTVKGLRSVDEEAFDLLDSLAASRLQVFTKLRVPVSLPYLFAALRVAATLAVIGAIVGEFAGADRGLGFFIMISSHRLETVDMFVGIVLSSLLGIGMFYSVVVLERIFVPWAHELKYEVA